MSKHRLALSIVLVATLLIPGFSASLAQPVALQPAPTVSAASGSMLIVENAGQWPEAARFQVWNSPLGPGTTWLAQDAIWLVVSIPADKDQAGKEGGLSCRDSLGSLSLRDGIPSTCLPAYFSVAIKLTFPGSNSDVRIEPFAPADSTVSYFLDDDRTKWRPNVPVWRGVRYVDLYPGVNLIVGGIEDDWRLEAAPGAAVQDVRMQVDSAGALKWHVDKALLSGDNWTTAFHLPSASFPYRATDVSADEASWSLNEPTAGSAILRGSPLTPPEGLVYSTFLGGTLEDGADGVVVDETGHAIVVGGTTSPDFPTSPGVIDPTQNGSVDAFVVKLNPAGSSLEYATFLGGEYSDIARDVALDGVGNATVAGYSEGRGFPTTPGAFSTSENGNGSGFVLWQCHISDVGSLDCCVDLARRERRERVRLTRCSMTRSIA